MKNARNEMEESKEFTLNEVVEYWFENIKVLTKESTYSKYYMLVYSHILPELGELKMTQLKPVLLERYVSKKWQNGRIDGKGALSANTVRLLTCILQSILQYAKQLGYTELSYTSISKPKISQKSMELFTKEEQKCLEDYIFKKSDLAAYGIYICLYTGLRLGEICALTWNDIYLEGGYLKVSKNLQRIQIADYKSKSEKNNQKTKILIDIPKSQSSIRDVPLTPSLNKLLKNLKISCTGSFYVLTGTTHYMDPRTYQKKFKKYLKECNLKARNFHILRHQFASNCVIKGVDIKSLSEILGHSNVNITLNRYVHTTMELKKAQINKLEDL